MEKMIRHRAPKSQQTLTSAKPASPKDVSKSCYGIALLLFVILLIITFISFYANNDPPHHVHSHSHSIYPQDFAKHNHNHNDNDEHNDNHQHNDEHNHKNDIIERNDEVLVSKTNEVKLVGKSGDDTLGDGYVKGVLINDDNCDWRPEILGMYHIWPIF